MTQTSSQMIRRHLLAHQQLTQEQLAALYIFQEEANQQDSVPAIQDVAVATLEDICDWHSAFLPAPDNDLFLRGECFQEGDRLIIAVRGNDRLKDRILFPNNQGCVLGAMAIDGYEAALQDCFFLERYAGRVGTTIHAHMARTQFQEQLQLMGEFARLFRHDVGNNLLGSELFADSIRSTCQKLPSNKDTHRIHQLADMIYTELQTTKKLVALVGMMDITPEQAQRHATEQYVCDAFRSCLAHDIATVWQSRQYDVIFSVPKGTLDCRMRMNETYLTTIVENVIGNALKYTPLGGTIFMYLEHDKKGLHFNLVNTVDRALLPEDLQQVTQRGFRTGSASRSPTVGLDQGLGLYMIDRLIRDGYGGKLEPHSAATYDLTPFLDPGTHEVTYMGVDRPRGHISPYYSLGMFLPGETIHLDG